MFKKLLSSVTIMLLAFCMNAGAQVLQVHKSGARTITPKYAATPMTSVLDIAKDELWIGYWNGENQDDLGYMGVDDVPMQYDVAIGYPAGDLSIKDKEITGMRFTFPDSESVENLRVWMSTALPATAEEADIVCDTVINFTGLQNAADPFNEIRFTKPYTVDDTKPLYIGYSFEINKGDTEGARYPIVMDESTPDKENAMHLKFTANGWADYSLAGFGVLAIQVLIKGDYPDNAVSMPAQLPDAKALVDYSDITFPIKNAGTNPVSSITVESGAYPYGAL